MANKTGGQAHVGRNTQQGRANKVGVHWVSDTARAREREREDAKKRDVHQR